MVSLDTLSLWELVTNIGSAAVCLATVFILLGFRSEWEKSASLFVPLKDNMASGYTYMKRLVAGAAFLGFMMDLIVAAMIWNGVDFSLLSVMAMPTTYYFQLHFSTFALLYLIHSPLAKRRRDLWLSLPVLFILIIYTLCFAIWSDFHNGYEPYKAFCETTVSHILSGVVVGIVLVEVITAIFLLRREVKRYQIAIDNFFSGKLEVNAIVMAKIVYCFIAYFALVVLNSVLMMCLPEDISRILNLAIVAVNTIIFTAIVIVILNLHNFYFAVAQGFSANEGADPNDLLAVMNNTKKADVPFTDVEISATPETLQTPDISQVPDNSEVVKKKPAAVSSTSSSSKSPKTVEALVAHWSNAFDKRFLREGLTINDVAADMDVSPRLLSDYLNNVCQMNFNAWINSLRVVEVKRILTNEPQETLASIAYRTGFTDASAMSKVFKKFEQITPSAFRNQISKDGKA